ncbi:putative PKHD-type hydroxylase [Artemisia annua]|uniref:Putative PKHD-type hydroxylase n=1 Tax=Artemisia annua TaxID=35608 RepID=A0A2U1Q1V2_ARTAN|nr:putative PKHD-type hydroxylase [Artemisia annua]
MLCYYYHGNHKPHFYFNTGKGASSFHVDDSEVTLNVCLGKQFTGGDLFFRAYQITWSSRVNSLGLEMDVVKQPYLGSGSKAIAVKKGIRFEDFGGFIVE